MFDTGILTIHALTVVSNDGEKPEEVLTSNGASYYGERTVSASRLYEALGADVHIDKLVRVPFDTNVQVNQYVNLEDGKYYRVVVVSPVIVRRDMRALELTLERAEF